jgi:hypothetical protein
MDASLDQPVREFPRSESSEHPAAGTAPPAPSSEPTLPEEPIDRISAFHLMEERQSEEQDEGNDTGFGRHRRPFTPHRRGRQVKPRESKVRQSLGGDQSKEADEPSPGPPITQPEPRGRSVRMENGIGPIDLDESDSPEAEEE